MGQIYAEAWLDISISGEAQIDKGLLSEHNVLSLRSSNIPLFSRSETAKTAGHIIRYEEVVCTPP